MSFVRIDSGPIAFADEGSGPPVVMVHGLPGSSRDFRWLAPALSHARRVLRPDLPGFGGTPESTAPGYDVKSRAAVIAAFLRATVDEPVVLVGHSMGGVIATRVAADHPERVKMLVLVSSPGLTTHRGLRRAGARVLGPVLRSPRRARALSPLMDAIFARAGFRGSYPPGALRRTMLQLEAMDLSRHAEHIRRLGCPTAVVWCEDDPMIETEIAEALAAACPPGPRLSFSDGGHNPQKHHAIEISRMLLAPASSGSPLWPPSGKRGTP